MAQFLAAANKLARGSVQQVVWESAHESGSGRRRSLRALPHTTLFVFFIVPATRRLDRKKPAPKHSGGLLNSSGKGVRYDHRLCESFDNGAES